MTITKDSSRQWPLVATLDLTYSTLGTAIQTTEVQEAFDLPSGAIVVGGHINVTTAWVGPTAANLDIGDGGDDDRYTSTIVDLTATGRVALILTGYEYPAADTIDTTYTSTVAVSTAGAAQIVLEYVIDGRANENAE